jgi:glutathione S-transferase
VFERYFRVQMNTLELLVVFVPAMFIFSQYFGGYLGAGLGVVYLIGRLVYFTSYVKDPGSRGLGYGLSVLPIMIMVVGAVIGAIRAAVLTL